MVCDRLFISLEFSGKEKGGEGNDGLVLIRINDLVGVVWIRMVGGWYSNTNEA